MPEQSLLEYMPVVTIEQINRFRDEALRQMRELVKEIRFVKVELVRTDDRVRRLEALLAKKEQLLQCSIRYNRKLRERHKEESGRLAEQLGRMTHERYAYKVAYDSKVSQLETVEEERDDNLHALKETLKRVRSLQGQTNGFRHDPDECMAAYTQLD